MARTFKQPPKQNLSSIPVLIEDTSFYSQYFEINDLNRILHAGKNGFLIRGSDFLQNGSEIYIEVLDRFQNPIYSTPINGYSDGGSRLISIEVYQKTERGPGTLTIVGTAKQYADGRPIPPKYLNTPNVRWTVPIQIEPRNPNTNKIILNGPPSSSVSVLEKLFTTTQVETRKYTVPAYTASLTYDYDVHISDGYAIRMEDSAGSKVPFFDISHSIAYFTGSIARRKIYRIYGVPEEEDYEYILDPPLYEFDYTGILDVPLDYYDYGALVEIFESSVDSNLDLSTYANVYLPIDKILDESKAITNTPIIFDDGTDLLDGKLYSGSFERVVETATLNPEFIRHTVEIYDSSVIYTYISVDTLGTENTSSILTFNISNVATSVGEVHKVRILAKESNTSIASYQYFTEFKPSESNLLITTSSMGQHDIGYFQTDAILQENWFSSLFYNEVGEFNKTDYENSASVGSLDKPIVTSSIRILEGAYVSDVDYDDVYFFGNKNSVPLISDTEYTLKYTMVYSPTRGQNITSVPGTLRVYLTQIGNTPSDRILSSVVATDGDPYGKLIDTIVVRDVDKSRYEREVNFVVPSTGNAYLRFVS